MTEEALASSPHGEDEERRWRSRRKKIVGALVAVACLIAVAGMVVPRIFPGGVPIRIYNDTQASAYDVTVTWGENKQTFAEIPPGKYAKFRIPTYLLGLGRNVGGGVNMSYVWQEEKYEYPDMIICLMPDSGTMDAEDFRIRGKTAVSYMRYAFCGPGSPEQIGIVRKPLKEEEAILKARKALWKTADQIEVRKRWMEKVSSPGTSSWEWQRRESDWLPLPVMSRRELVSLLDTLRVPVRSTLDERNSGKFEIRISRGEEIFDHLWLTGYNGIIHVQGINTALRFAPNATPCEILLAPLFP